MNRSPTIRSGQCHVQRYLQPLLERVRNGDIDPSFVITHRMRLDEAPAGYEIFENKEDECVKVVLKPLTAQSTDDQASVTSASRCDPPRLGAPTGS